MTYAEIVERRCNLAARMEQVKQEQATLEPPEQQQFVLRRMRDDSAPSGISYQGCGGGYRVIRKRIGGA